MSTTPSTGPATRFAHVDHALDALSLTHAELWVAYFAVGGSHPIDDLDHWIAGTVACPDHEYSVIIQAVDDLHRDRNLPPLTASPFVEHLGAVVRPFDPAD